MNDEEYAQVLQEVRGRTRESGRRDLDELLVESRVVDASTSKEALLAYLDGLRDDMRLRSAATAQNVLSRFQRFQTENGIPIQAIVVDVQEWDLRTFDTDVIDLTETPALDEAIIEIDELITLIAQDEGPR